jgi:hypothetical protein
MHQERRRARNMYVFEYFDDSDEVELCLEGILKEGEQFWITL